MTTKTKEVRIGAITLTDGGNKGLVVTYEQTEVRNNREFFTEYSAKKKFPIHEELNNQVQSLAQYLLEICNYTDAKQLIPSTEVTGIKYNDKGFLISGKLTTISDKTFAINTPLITFEDGYPDHDKITAILDSIYSETKEYMEGKKVLSDVQYVLGLNKLNPDFDQKTFESLPPEEQWKIASEYMAKNKCFVTKMDDLEEEVEPFEFTPQAPTADDWADPKPLEEVNVPFVHEEGALENQPETTLTVSDDDFILPIEPVKESKAKKKAS